ASRSASGIGIDPQLMGNAVRMEELIRQIELSLVPELLDESSYDLFVCLDAHWASTRSTSPSIPFTITFWPASILSRERACHNSFLTKTTPSGAREVSALPIRPTISNCGHLFWRCARLASRIMVLSFSKAFIDKLVYATKRGDGETRRWGDG